MMLVEGNATTPESALSPPTHVVAKAPMVVLISLGVVAILLVLAVVVIIAAVVVEVHAFLNPIYPESPESVSKITLMV